MTADLPTSPGRPGRAGATAPGKTSIQTPSPRQAESPAPVVLKLGGRAIEDPSPPLLTAIAALAEDTPGGLVLVHGGGGEIDRWLDRLGLSSQRRDGLRLTPPDHMPVVTAVLAGLVNTRLVGALRAAGARAVGLTLGDGGMAQARPHSGLGADAGRVGEVTGGDGAILRCLTAGGFLPVVSSIAFDAAGWELNVNADDAAAGLAKIVGARSLVLLTDTPGIRGADGQVIGEIDAAGVEAQIDLGVIGGGMIAKARAAARAAETSGVPAIIASWADPSGLAAAVRGGSGTRVAPAAAPHRC